MTEEELKQEAEEYATKRASKLYTRNMWDRYYQTYIDSAKPREKEIKSLGERCLQLQKDKGELIDKTRELERKIASIRGSHRVDLAKLNARIEQVERLKKENAELRDKVKELEEELIEADNATDVFNAQEKRIAELEKENAELKKENLILHEMNLKRIEYYNLLTKAKELLERFLNVGDLWGIDGEKFIDLQNDVTQFLKEE